MAKVVTPYPGDQGQVRSVTVLIGKGPNLERPVNKLVLLVEVQQRPGFLKLRNPGLSCVTQEKEL